MSLKSIFEVAAQKARVFFDSIEASQLESKIAMARSGYVMFYGSGRFTQVIPLSKEDANNMIACCEERLAELRKPSPASPQP